ncbi:polysaccharide biosynthesis tyrosine autokinase [Budviciaceae bacterium CWB-B4]|uniref:Polysaccharide biosynthesis tyrosine autokinase n=1 Tax=Limnobaculum xujianqingii TaxID=2738837 RepID=A0A9D7FZM5_9GAMM|nr:polysaccharide biosynthesis tyrosine autokinase [Limnobaculum xujianqingii]MBK5074970.1 polysaccharide biosynthesis tyrosine autokinase [Limnobaculum xujianqingii]MBK5178280.1 polysaccharide biosynthesis tyrosine autokinase [Limnobaculum xujianqingii]
MSENRSTSHKNPKEEDEINLGKILGTIIDKKWLLISITILLTLIGAFYSLFATPIYRADILIQIEKNPSNSLLNSVSEILSSNITPSTATEIELIKSRMVIGKTVSDLSLDIEVSEKYFPIVGEKLSKWLKIKPAQVAISKFDVPETMYNDEFTLTVLSDNQYNLKGDSIDITGKIASLEKNNNISILISDIIAPVGTTFKIKKKDYLTTINNVLLDLSIQDTTKDGGILRLYVTGKDKEKIKKIADSISNNYLQQNVERKSEEAANSLDFLKEQLPLIKKQLEEAEFKLNTFRQTNESVDLTLEAKSILDSMVAITSQLNEVTFKEAEISKLYTKEHPAYRSLLEKKNTLLQEKERLNKSVTNMPKTQQEILRLTRDVQSGQEIYMLLLNKQQELNISKASTVGNARIIDRAITQPEKIKPKSLLIVALSFVAGIFLSILIIFIQELFRRTINDSSQLESIGINIYANIPLSKNLKNRNRKQPSTNNTKLLAVEQETDLAVEAIRSLRTSLHFAMLDASNRILMITGATSGIGKSFISSNLAVVVAQSGVRVLLIDADMRKGGLHKLFKITMNNGLSDILSNNKEIEKCVYKTSVNGLDFIPRGAIPPNPSELLMNKYFSAFVEWAGTNYDLIIFDTPPILATTDSMIIGRYSGTNLLVARFEHSSVREVEMSLKRFEQNGLTIKGLVLNAVQQRASKFYGDGVFEYYSYKSENNS